MLRKDESHRVSGMFMPAFMLLMLLVLLTDKVSAQSLTSDIQNEDFNVSAGKVVRVMRSFSPDEKAENNYRNAVKYLQAGHLEKAEDLLKVTLGQSPAHLAARDLLILSYMNKGQWDNAKTLIDEGLVHAPYSQQLSIALVRVYMEQGDDEAALKIFETINPEKVNQAQYWGVRATLFQRLGRYQESRDSFVQALRSRPQELRWWLGLGISAEALQDWPVARDAYQRVAEQDYPDEHVVAYIRQRLEVVESQLQEKRI
jgi:MSHA biogenesis protein MshN